MRVRCREMKMGSGKLCEFSCSSSSVWVVTLENGTELHLCPQHHANFHETLDRSMQGEDE